MKDSADSNHFQNGAISSKLVGDVKILEAFPRTILEDAMNASSFLIMAIIAIAVIQPSLLFLIVFLLPFSIYVNTKTNTALGRINHLFRLRFEWMIQRAIDYIDISRFLYIQNRGRNLKELVCYQIERVGKLGNTVDKARAKFKSIAWMSLKLFEIISVVTLVYYAINNLVTVGEMSSLIYYLCGIAEWILWVISLSPEFSEAKESLSSIEAMDIKRPRQIDPDETAEAFREMRVSLVDCSYRYPTSEENALNNIACDFGPGGLVCVVGPSGSGKSTLLRIIVGDIIPNSGTIKMNGIDSRACQEAFRNSFSYVPQSSVFLNSDLSTNITLLDEFTKENIRDAVKLSSMKHASPGDDTSLTRRISSGGCGLSAGQLQRLAIARAIVRKPGLLVMDEPTSNLDPETEFELIENIKAFSRSQTTIIATHSLPLMQASDVIVVVASGRITSIGNFPSLESTDPYLRRCMNIFK